MPSPEDPIAIAQRHRAAARRPISLPPPASPRRGRRSCCLIFLLSSICLALFAGLILFLPGRSNILLLGIDARPEDGLVARTDTLVLMTIEPLKPYIGLLSIPRDLWVFVPGVGENRINTAHFFGELASPGNGPEAALETVRQNFGLKVDYYVRLRFDGLQQIVDAMGGVAVHLDQPLPGFPAGDLLLDGEQALAFVRNRTGSDDFFRMASGQLFIKALWRQLLSSNSWSRLPRILSAFRQSIDTNIPFWQWPRLGLALLRSGPAGVDSRVITRDMVNPFTTAGGAQVLGPNWESINPVLLEMFGP
jgi:LCP family protein required for cell wall assembly